MIKKVTITNHLGKSLEIDLTKPEESGFAITSMTGLGPGTATINTAVVSTSDGGFFNSARLPERNIVISLRFIQTSTLSIEDVRLLSYKYFPIKKAVTLLIETENRELTIEGRVETNDPTIFSSEEGSDISIICPYPYFYSSAKNTTVFSGTESNFEFPFSNESLEENLLEIGYIRNLEAQNIDYDGDGEVGITIYIHAVGTAHNIKIHNVLTKEVMAIDSDKIASITGSDIIYGDDITICTVTGSKSITLTRAGVTYNILNCLSKDVDWLQLSKGTNVLVYTAEEGSANLQFSIVNQIIYEGV